MRCTIGMPRCSSLILMGSVLCSSPSPPHQKPVAKVVSAACAALACRGDAKFAERIAVKLKDPKGLGAVGGSVRLRSF